MLYLYFCTFSDINHPPKFLNPIQTEVVLEGISIGSSIFQPSITDEDLSDVHTFLVSYSPPEGAVYFGVDTSSKSHDFYQCYYHLIQSQSDPYSYVTD